jgi:hypothetical protein
MLLADSTVTVHDIERGYSSLIVSGLIIVGLLVLGIWWLKRNS